MNNKSLWLYGAILLVCLLEAGFTSALIIQDVNIDPVYPGDTQTVKIQVENDGSDDIQDVAFSLDLTGLPFSTVGSSGDIIDELNEDDSDSFMFVLRADTKAKPGNYNIPYVLTYKNNSVPLKGTFGVLITGKTDLEFSASAENPIIGSKGKINLKIINKGNGDARYVNLNIAPNGYTALSESKVYVGTVSADDFETVSIDAIFNKKSAAFEGILEYTDLDNNKLVKSIELPLTLYTQDEAVQKGIVAKNNTALYAGIVVVIIVVWLVWRAIAKRIRRKRSMQRQATA